jgi:hypothetical protein
MSLPFDPPEHDSVVSYGLRAIDTGGGNAPFTPGVSRRPTIKAADAVMMWGVHGPGGQPAATKLTAVRRRARAAFRLPARARTYTATAATAKTAKMVPAP